MSRWAGVDPGEKRIGVARSDALGMLARPEAIVGSIAELVSLLSAWIRDEGLAGVVVGLPRNMDGTIGPIARRSLALIRRLREDLLVSVVPWDERLTTRQVERRSPPRGAKEPIDDRVAALILQSFLDGGCRVPPDPPEMAAVPAEGEEAQE